MYNPQLVAMIEVADSMVVRRETNDPKSDVVLSFKRYDDARPVDSSARRVVVPFRNLRTGLYVRGRYATGCESTRREWMSAYGPPWSLIQRARVIVYTDEVHGVQDLMGRPMWIGNTVIVARPLSTV